MADQGTPNQDAPEQAEPHANGQKNGDHQKKPDLMRDWFSLWQSELSAMATDREAQEGWQRMTRAWTNAFSPPGGVQYDGLASPGAAASAWAAAAAHASGRRDAEFERLVNRVAELERRLAELERRS